VAAAPIFSMGRLATLLTIMGVALLPLMLLGLMMGPVWISPAGVMRALAGQLGAVATAAGASEGLILFAIRLPRVILAGRLGVNGGPPGPAGPDVTRQAMRLATAFFLDSTCHTAKVMGLDVLGVLTLRTINMANVRHVTHDPKLAVAHAGLADVVADAERRPLSVYALSKFLLMPYETARRTVLRLEERGLVERAPKGLVVSSDVVNRPEVVAGILDLVALTEAYLADLAAIGVAYQPES